MAFTLHTFTTFSGRLEWQSYVHSKTDFVRMTHVYAVEQCQSQTGEAATFHECILYIARCSVKKQNGRVTKHPMELTDEYLVKRMSSTSLKKISQSQFRFTRSIIQLYLYSTFYQNVGNNSSLYSDIFLNCHTLFGAFLFSFWGDFLCLFFGYLDLGLRLSLSVPSPACLCVLCVLGPFFHQSNICLMAKYLHDQTFS